MLNFRFEDGLIRTFSLFIDFRKTVGDLVDMYKITNSLGCAG